MTRFPAFALFLAFASLAATGRTETPVLLWETTGLSGPESIVFHHQANVLYVSNMGTYGDGATPGDGFISRLSPTGEILDRQWVTGLDNPKGLAVANGRLYVGDDRGLAEIDPVRGVIAAWHVPADGEPGGFNDCTADPNGNVYVYSSRLRTVFRLHAGVFAPWVEIDQSRTGGLNGLRAESDRLLLGGWSVRDAQGEQQLGHLSTVRLADKSIGRIGNQPICHIDGIEPDGRGGYTVTDWMTGDVLHVTADGVPTPLMKLQQGAADHEYVIEQQLLLIPLMKDDVVRAYRWSPAQ